MGNANKKENIISQPEPAAFEKPWRQMSWSDKTTILDQLKDFKPGNPKLGTLRCLLTGPPGAGKSSFINSINSIFQGHMLAEALADNIGGHTFTKTHNTFYIEDRRTTGSKFSFAFVDTVGVEGKKWEDLYIQKALKGQIKEGYKHTPEVALSDDDPYYRKNPSLDDQVHCLITVVAADKVALMKDETVKTLKDIRLAARDLGIPQICILTRIDVACPLVAEDLKAVYTSKYIKEQMMGLNAKIGIPMNCIVPVKNYHEEIDLNNDVDMLLLRALTHIVNFADDHVRNLHCKNENI